MVHSPTAHSANESLPSTPYGCLIKRKHRHRIRRPTGDSSSNQSPPRYLRPVFSYETERASSRHPDVKAETSAYLTGKGLTATTRNHSQIEKVKISAFATRKL